MKKFICFIISIMSSGWCQAQLDLQCDGRDLHAVYLVSTDNNIIYRIDSVDTNPTSLITVQSVPAGTIGITINANLDSAAMPTTMYYVKNPGHYYYWNGTGWTYSGHMSGVAQAVNPGGTDDYIFNIGGNSVYRYDGTANGTMLITIFSGIMMPDVATDSLGNFYLFYMSTQKIVAFTASGVPIDTFSVSGPAGFNLSGAGFALLGNRFYYEKQYTLYQGIVSGDSVIFSLLVDHPGIWCNDLAVCPSSGFPVAVFEAPELPHFVIYPNPSRDVAVIKLHNTGQLLIYNQLGALCERIPVTGFNEYHLDVSRYKPGMYFITAVSASGTTATEKLLVQEAIQTR